MTIQQSIDYHAEQLKARCPERTDAEEEIEEVVTEIIEEHPNYDEQEVLIKFKAALDRIY
jgi:hypothetical protein